MKTSHRGQQGKVTQEIISKQPKRVFKLTASPTIIKFPKRERKEGRN